jgi:hypothetical protein
MKKKYIIPEVEVIELGLQTMLCISGDIGEEATEPALAPELGEELGVDLGEELDLGW